jgi:hypothetical protein
MVNTGRQRPCPPPQDGMPRVGYGIGAVEQAPDASLPRREHSRTVSPATTLDAFSGLFCDPHHIRARSRHHTALGIPDMTTLLRGARIRALSHLAQDSRKLRH